jgi:hypothetical protein
MPRLEVILNPVESRKPAPGLVPTTLKKKSNGPQPQNESRIKHAEKSNRRIWQITDQEQLHWRMRENASDGQ